MTDHRWQDFIPYATRDKMLAGKLPHLIHDERPAYAQGDRIVLEEGRIQDPEVGTTITYPAKWITVAKVSADGARWITDYSPPQAPATFLRRGGGTTTDRYLSADPQVEAEQIEVTPEARAKNTLIQERRRIEGNLAEHQRRYLRAKTPATRKMLAQIIRSCQDKLAQIQERDAA